MKSHIRKAVMALDQGTTSSRAIVFAHDGTILGSAQEEFAQHYPRPGWVEHDPEQIWQTQLRSCRTAFARAGLELQDLVAIGIANQRETVLLWDSETGRPLGNAIVWQCRRTAERCGELRDAGLEPMIEARTGLRLDPYFSATKIEWLLANREGARELAAAGRLRAGTIDSFLVWRLTGGRCHVTDHSNASRTMLLDLHSLEWALDLTELFGVPKAILPSLCSSCGVVGLTEPSVLGAAIPIAGIAGDQQAALFGQAAFAPGDSKNTYGTGCFLLMNTGPRPMDTSSTPMGPSSRGPEPSPHGLITTVAWTLESLRAERASSHETGGSTPRSSEITYALEGSVFMAGGAVQWLRDGLALIDAPSDIGPLAAQASDNGGIFFVPALTGLGSPYWDPSARGLLIGLTRGTTRSHVARATEEAICFQTRAVLDAMRAASGLEVEGLRVDGGAAADDFLLQLQADLLGIPVVRPRTRETTALGAAALAGLAIGFWSPDELAELAGSDREFAPTMTADERDTLYSGWQRAVERALHWTR